MCWPGDDRLLRSDSDYGGSGSDADESPMKWYHILLLPVLLISFLVFSAVIVVLPVLVGAWLLLTEIYSSIRTRIRSAKSPGLALVYTGVYAGIWLALILFVVFGNLCPSTLSDPPRSTSPAAGPSVPAATSTTIFPHPPTPTGTVVGPSVAVPASTRRDITILLDDFQPQTYPGGLAYYYNRLEGDRGAINDSILEWGHGQVTTTVSSGNSWGGAWLSLNHPLREGLPIDFSAILPPQIMPAYQSRITGVTVQITRGTPNRTFKLELKDGGELRWKNEIALDGGPQVVSSDLPALGNINEFLWVLDHASAGDYAVLESVSFTATTQITDTATAAFAWSYGMLLNNWNPAAGLVRDKARNASGEFDGIQDTGSLAAATASAEQLGFVTRADAIQIVGKISDTLLLDLPRFHGLWPHWVEVSPTGAITIVQNTEWSSVDTVIAAIGLLDAQSGLGLDTSGTERMLQAIDWNDLATPGGIAHGYAYTGDLIPYAWDVFGGESWLVELAYAAVTGRVAPITYLVPPTANGSGFIDELVWLFVLPPSGQDYWGTDWTSYRSAAADSQVRYYPTNYATSCLAQSGLFGLSAAELPCPSMVPGASIYQAFGVGGRFAPANDGTALLGAPVVVPHYSAMIASLRPQEAIEMWNWLINYGYFTPLNNVESLVFPAGSSCDHAALVWSGLKGSWNLSLQVLGWGRYLAERRGQVPVLWQATRANPLLRRGYLLVASPNPHLRPVTCSSMEGSDYVCGNAVDGNLTTRWSSQFSDPQWIYVDLGAWQYIERVILRWETAYGKAYRLQTSDDSFNWTDIYSTTSGDGEVDNLDVSGAGRYVRVYATQRGTGWGYSLWELEVYARPNSIHLPLLLRHPRLE